MADNGRPLNGDRLASGPPSQVEQKILAAEDFQASFGEDIQHTLDLNTWRGGTDLSDDYSRIEREIREAVVRETEVQKTIRQDLLPRLKTRAHAPKNAGVYPADLKVIERIHRELLFQGGMEACDGILQTHATLPLTIYQIGVSLVSYQGNEGTWCQRLFRRDLRQSFSNPVDEAIAILEQRSPKNGISDGYGELVHKVILEYAARVILLRRSKARWRLGRGHPVPYELLTGGGILELMVAATKVLRELVEYEKFVFVAQEPRDRMLFTIAESLRPMEFAIIQTLDEQMEHWLHQLRFKVSKKLEWDHEPISPTEWIPRFIHRVASKIVVGLFRASAIAPAKVFYAHINHADYAAHMVLADSVLQEHRGSPLLTDIARHVCDAVFGSSLDGLAETAYAAAGAPLRYVNHHRFNRR